MTLLSRRCRRGGALIALLVVPTVASPPETRAAEAVTGGTSCPADRLTFAPATSAQLQAALDCAEPGATITLTAGRVYEGNFILRSKPVAYDADGITPKRIRIVSTRLESLLARARARVAPDDERHMAWLKTPPRSTAPVLRTELKTLPDGRTRLGANAYRLGGIKFFASQWVTHLVQLGTGTETLVSELPDDIAFDRSYFAGSPGEGTKKGLLANGRHIAVTNSHFKDFKDTANDAQAIAMWNGAGPLTVVNNYLEGSGENLMIGGGDPTISGLVPGDITIRGNHFFKPTAWTSETSTQSGSPRGKKWRIKNLFELKNAERVVFEGNVLENNWIQADQQGFAILLSPRNQSGGCPWCRIKDVTVASNLIRHSIAGIKLLATDDLHPSGPLQNVLLVNNLFVNINARAVAETNPGDRAGRLIQITNPYQAAADGTSPSEPMNVTVERNTGFATREFSFSSGSPTSGVVFRKNVARHNSCMNGNDCGISGTGTKPGADTFRRYFDALPDRPTLGVYGNIFFAAGRDRTADCVPAAPSDSKWEFTGNSFPDSVRFRSAVDLMTGLPTDGQPPNYTVSSADGEPVGAGADWGVLAPLIEAALAGMADTARPVKAAPPIDSARKRTAR